MEGSDIKFLKLHKKNLIQSISVGFLLLNFACSSTPEIQQRSENDAQGNFGRQAQVNWEKNSGEASAEQHFIMAQAFSQDGKVDRAIEEYRAALAHDPNSSILYAKLAAEYLKKGSMTFAIEACEKSLELDPHAVEVMLMLGGIYSVNNEFDRALTQYDRVLKLEPDNDEAAVFKTQVLAEKEKIDEALSFIKKFNREHPESAATWFYEGKLDQAKDLKSDAVRAYRKAIELRPGFNQASLALGIIFEQEQQPSKAIEVYETQLDERYDAQVSGRLVTLYLKSNQTDRALKLLNTQSIVDPEDLNARLRIGLIHMQKEEWTKAEEVFQSLLKQVPDSDKVHFYLSATLEQLGRTEETVQHLKQVSVDSKLFEDANLHIVGLYRKWGRHAEAREALSAAIKLSPENAGFYIVLASLHEDEKQVKDAVNALEAGLKVFPDHEKMRYFYGALLEKQGKIDESVEQMQIVLEKNPEHADAMNFIAYTWTNQGVRLKDAESLLKKAIALRPNNPYILDSLGWNQFMLGNAREALVFLEKAAKIKGDEEAILEHLVQVYAKNQMPERAQATRSRIQNLKSLSAARSPASSNEK